MNALLLALLPRHPRMRQIQRSVRRMTTNNESAPPKQRFCGLDLRGQGLSVVERLCLEECLLRHDHRQWILWGTHDPLQSRFLPDLPRTNRPHPCIIVMGIGGKPELLLDVEKVRQDGICVIKRFSGGGTVVVDGNCLYTTIIGRTNQLTHIPPYPREIMAWTATDVFGPTFGRLQQRAQQRNASLDYPEFQLLENDYVLGGTQKVAGNAQSIVKTGFLHHTTFLWSYHPPNMRYLTLPAKRPPYRQGRTHSNFLIQLSDAYHNQLDLDSFFDSLAQVCNDSFQVDQVSLQEALAVVTNVVGEEGGLLKFFEQKSRTRIVDLSGKQSASPIQEEVPIITI